MKYRVKYKCYWYNTGAGDNHYYINNEDFDTIEEAEAFKQRVNKQKDIHDDKSDGWVSRTKEWNKSSDYIEIENGFIVEYAMIVKFYPSVEGTL